jgi:hypothetical protein
MKKRDSLLKHDLAFACEVAVRAVQNPALKEQLAECAAIFRVIETSKLSARRDGLAVIVKLPEKSLRTAGF